MNFWTVLIRICNNNVVREHLIPFSNPHLFMKRVFDVQYFKSNRMPNVAWINSLILYALFLFPCLHWTLFSRIFYYCRAIQLLSSILSFLPSFRGLGYKLLGSGYLHLYLFSLLHCYIDERNEMREIERKKGGWCCKLFSIYVPVLKRTVVYCRETATTRTRTITSCILVRKF